MWGWSGQHHQAAVASTTIFSSASGLPPRSNKVEPPTSAVDPKPLCLCVITPASSVRMLGSIGLGWSSGSPWRQCSRRADRIGSECPSLGQDRWYMVQLWTRYGSPSSPRRPMTAARLPWSVSSHRWWHWDQIELPPLYVCWDPTK